MAQRIVPVRAPIADGKDIVREGPADFAMYHDGAYIGSRSTRLQAETDLDQYVYDLLQAEAVTSADAEAEAISTVPLDLDCLVAAHEAQDDTKAQQRAWEWLAALSTVTMQGTAYLIPSARWSNTTYTTTATSCTCEARKRCWHQHAAATLDLAREHAAIDTAAEQESLLDRYVADQAAIGHIVSPRDRAIVAWVDRRAAIASGVADLFV